MLRKKAFTKMQATIVGHCMPLSYLASLLIGEHLRQSHYFAEAQNHKGIRFLFQIKCTVGEILMPAQRISCGIFGWFLGPACTRVREYSTSGCDKSSRQEQQPPSCTEATQIWPAFSFVCQPFCP